MTTLVHNEICCTVSEPHLESAKNQTTNSRQLSMPILDSELVPASHSTRVPLRTRFWSPLKSHLHGVQPGSRQRGPDRRLFFSFNQMLLSFLAPRLMRYQFDLMMHSVVAELFRKVLVPSIGSIAGGESSGSLLGSLGNLFRQRQTAPKTTTAAPNVDVQRLLDNAQKLITLQTLLRNGAGGQSQRATSQAAGVVGDAARIIPHPIEAKTTTEHPNVTRSAQADHPTTTRASTFSPIDFISFLQNNFKTSSPSSNYNTSEAHSNAKNRVSQVAVNHQTEPKVLSTSSDQFGTDQAVSGFKLHSKLANQGNPSQKTKKNHRTRLEDFKMSHLTYIDTEVPNYGNQLLIRDQEESSHNEVHSQVPDMRNHASFDLPLIHSDNSALKSNEDLERANRWNDVLTNMNRFG